MHTLGNLGFVVCGLVLTLHAWLVSRLPAFEGMYRDFSAPLPTVTRIALSPAWRYGSLLVVLALLVAAIVGRRKLAWLPLVAALLAIAICAGTYWAAEWPIYQLAGSIQQ